MVVGEHDAGAAVLGGIGDDVAQREGRAGFVAVMAREWRQRACSSTWATHRLSRAGSASAKQPAKKLARGLEAVEFSGSSAR